MKQLLDMDNPVFAAGGNYAEEPQRTNVDTLPALWAAPDYPLVLVGSTDHGGARSGCDSIYKALYNEYTLWGAGLQAQLKGCALFSLGVVVTVTLQIKAPLTFCPYESPKTWWRARRGQIGMQLLGTAKIVGPNFESTLLHK
ncbi:hypothetical protein NA56DRAFT_705368 [Hyaloscypha hepaticicola]|uniref:Uncharacterized protein n=1 Tax=Hyaloscypha hepaticicola TaxID=2082293 RepID=A0A2J6Q031_9HELO|nr:hypothetical protein NA56DRAFT_705368 [Hyaloscypha hepaticicola]